MAITPSEASVLKRANFGEVLTPIHKKLFFDAYNEKKPQYDKTFKVDSMDKKEATFPHLGAFGTWGENEEGNSFNHSAITEGDKATFTAKRYDKAYDITWELVQDDQYNVFKGAGKGGGAQKLGKGLRATEETQAAAVITGGFGNTGYDGVALFASTHDLADSVASGDNLVTGTLTDENLKAALTKMRLQVDEAGVLIAANANKLVVHPDWEFTARALIGSTLQAQTDQNDKNTLPGLGVVVWDYLAGGSTKPWYVQDSNVDNLMHLWREKPIFDSEKIADKMDYRFYGYCRFDVGYVDWRGLVGSTGVDPTGVLTVTSAASEETTGKTVIAVSPIKGIGNAYYYKTAASVTAPAFGTILDSGYTAWNGIAEITATTGHKILIVEADATTYAAKKVGIATVTSKAEA